MNTLNYNHLRYFWTVARYGSLSKASDELHLTPQTMSSQIRALEENLGEKLFDRSERRLILTESGHLAFRFAEEIFTLGRELTDTLAGRLTGRALRLVIGIADVLPKLVAERLVAPAFELEEQVRIVCRETRAETLLTELAVHGLDVVLSDAPIPPAAKVRAFNHLLGECSVVFMVAERLAHRYRKGFPGSLDDAPFLLPTEDTVLRSSLDQWFDAHSIRPKVVGEFQDSALLKAFGQSGTGVFAIPSVIKDEVRRQYRVRSIGTADGIVERFYAISVERKIQHPAVAAICDSARADLFI
ncbi:MAG: transcriptional activator NhaR [Proteobacteria bacterium]|nr:transcriptional activator NhaR [Pseudomonadota bacterium]